MRRSPRPRCNARIGGSVRRTTRPQMSGPAMGRAAVTSRVSTVIVAVRLLLALGKLLRNVGVDALIGLVKRDFAGYCLTEPADRRVEDQAVVGISLQPVGQRCQAADALAEHRKRLLGERARRGIIDTGGGKAEMARYEQRATIKFAQHILAGQIVHHPA